MLNFPVVSNMGNWGAPLSKHNTQIYYLYYTQYIPDLATFTNDASSPNTDFSQEKMGQSFSLQILTTKFSDFKAAATSMELIYREKLPALQIMPFMRS